MIVPHSPRDDALRAYRVLMAREVMMWLIGVGIPIAILIDAFLL